MQIQVRYTETLKQVLGMVLIPVVLVLSFIYVMVFARKYNVPELQMTIITIAGTLIILGISIFIVLKVLICEATLDFDTRGLYVSVLNNKWLFNSGIDIEYSNLKQFSAELDTYGRAFFSIKTKHPSKSFLLFPQNKEQTDNFLSLGEEIRINVNRYNQQQLEKGNKEDIISQKGFYESKGMKIFAYIIFFFMVLFTGLAITSGEKFPLWRLFFLYVVGIPFLYSVFKKSSEK